MNYLQKYQEILGVKPDGIVGRITANEICRDLDIEDELYFCNFIAQCYHESLGFTASRENLNYSAIALRKLFNKRFGDGEEFIYANHPEAIANRIYSGRMGNGDENSGDGWKYRGVGSIQLTGKNNIIDYLKYSHRLENTDPDKLLEPRDYFNIGKYFFDKNNLWRLCGDSIESITRLSKAINLGNPDSKQVPVGLEERIRLTLLYIKQLI